MTERDGLLELLDYDLWANLRWFEAAETAGLGLLLRHILWAQDQWLARCEGRTERVVEDIHPTTDRFRQTSSEWKSLIEARELDTVIEYRNATGTAHQNTIREILRQVLNHGTYHRGEMRGQCELTGKPFPETDYILYLRERASQP